VASTANNVPSCTLKIYINDEHYTVPIDTGAAVNVIPQKLLKKSVPLKKSSVILRTWTGEIIPVIGQFDATVKYARHEVQSTFYITKTGLQILVSHDLASKLGISLDLASVSSTSEVDMPVHIEDTLQTLYDGKQNLSIEPVRVQLCAKPEAKLIPARRIPLAYFEEVQN